MRKILVKILISTLISLITLYLFKFLLNFNYKDVSSVLGIILLMIGVIYIISPNVTLKSRTSTVGGWGPTNDLLDRELDENEKKEYVMQKQVIKNSLIFLVPAIIMLVISYFT